MHRFSFGSRNYLNLFLNTGTLKSYAKFIPLHRTHMMFVLYNLYYSVTAVSSYALTTLLMYLTNRNFLHVYMKINAIFEIKLSRHGKLTFSKNFGSITCLIKDASIDNIVESADKSIYYMNLLDENDSSHSCFLEDDGEFLDKELLLNLLASQVEQVSIVPLGEEDNGEFSGNDEMDDDEQDSK